MNIKFDDFMKPVPIPDSYYIDSDEDSEVIDFENDYETEVMQTVNAESVFYLRSLKEKPLIPQRKNGTGLTPTEYARNYHRNRKHVPSANKKLFYAVKKGDISKPTVCSRCGIEGKRIEGHHPDYKKPLEVLWLCKKCHCYEHKHVEIENLI